MKKYLFLIVCMGMIMPAFAGSWTLVKDATMPDIVKTDGVLIKASNAGIFTDIQPVTVSGIPFDTDNTNIGGGVGLGGGNLEGGRYYKDPNEPDLFNLLNTWKRDTNYSTDVTLEFNGLAVGMEHRLQMFTGWGWGWSRYRVVGAEGEPVKVEYKNGDNKTGVNVVEYIWTPTTPSATFTLEAYTGDSDDHAGDLTGYALFDLDSDPDAARNPSPWNGQAQSWNGKNGVDYNETILSWQPGDKALQHRIWFGASDPNNMVEMAIQDLGNEQYDPGSLMLNTTYYWRIDELNDDSTETTGYLWQFTTDLADQIIEDPNDHQWVANNAVAFIADPNFGTNFAISYDTDVAPYYAEITHTFETVMDMTDGGGAAIAFDSISSKDVANNAAPIYMILEDEFSNSSRVVALDADTAELAYYRVTTLNFALSDFTGIDVSRVKKMTIGIGNSDAPETGKIGRLMIEDIRRYPRRYRGALYPEDVDRNQTVDLNDLSLFAQQYLYSETITAVNSTDPNVSTDPNILPARLYYRFNEGAGTTAADSSSLLRYITDWGDIIWETSDCPDGSCVVFDGTNRKYKWSNNIIPRLSPCEFTLAFWAKPDPGTPFPYGVIAFRENVNDDVKNIPVRATIPNENGDIELSSTVFDGATSPLTTDLVDSWHHYAFVKSLDRGVVELYIDGVLVKRAASDSDDLIRATDFYLGGDDWYGRYIGKLDDLILYTKPVSQEVIVYLAKGPGGNVVQPPLIDMNGDGGADLSDLASMASLWLEELLWPLD